ncbi:MULTISPECIES: Abi family protein [Paenibacillus]|uniref:Abi family protein n=1 Tax=Paenibacillus xylanilyticus TaxID=248903 RepID=A0A7Y6EX50_9BACL|nr:Abi family protein [Paenibacillus xylanilyticus]NUU77394.1 Abi family protein [Paenibacillus xylanilyticus]
MPSDKAFNTIFDQIRLLKNRGLQINNFGSAKEHLKEKNYFDLINGHETLLLDDSKHLPKKYTKKSFDNFLRLYDFDKQFSSLILKKISEFETKLKTTISYHFCKNHCSTLAENNNYIDINYYNIPGSTDGPKQYVNYFYDSNNQDKTHKLFRSNYKYRGKFRGTFNGIVTYLPSKTILKGVFTGRFGSSSIREVKAGNCMFYNSNQRTLLAALHTVSTTSGSTVSLNLNIQREETIQGLNYIDDCKLKFSYINEYNNPPFWVVIKTLMLNDLIVLMYGLKKRTLDAVLRDFHLKPYEKEKFLNSLEIIRELRNSCAHFELVNRFRTSQSLKVNNHLISDLHLSPMRSQYVIKLFDVLKVLKMYIDLSEIKLFLHDFWINETKYGNDDITLALFERMGNSKINEWI